MLHEGLRIRKFLIHGYRFGEFFFTIRALTATGCFGQLPQPVAGGALVVIAFVPARSTGECGRSPRRSVPPVLFDSSSS